MMRSIFMAVVLGYTVLVNCTEVKADVIQTLQANAGFVSATGTSTLRRTGLDSATDIASIALNQSRGQTIDALFIHQVCWDDGVWIAVALDFPIFPYTATVNMDMGVFGTIEKVLTVTPTERSTVIDESGFDVIGFSQLSGVDFSRSETRRTYTLGTLPNTILVNELSAFGQPNGQQFSFSVFSLVSVTADDPVFKAVQSNPLRLVGVEAISVQDGTLAASFGVTPVPEPTTLSTFALGLLLTVWCIGRKETVAKQNLIEQV